LTLSNEEYFDEIPEIKKPLKDMEVLKPEELKDRIEKKIVRQDLNISNEKNWIETNEEKNKDVENNIKRLIYKK